MKVSIPFSSSCRTWGARRLTRFMARLRFHGGVRVRARGSAL